MKHLKPYKIFESSSNDLVAEVLEIYNDFIDHFNLSQSSHHKDWYSNKLMSFGVTTSQVRFGKGVKVIIQNSGPNGGRLIKEGGSKGFDGISSDVATELKKAHNRCMDHFKFKDCVIGSYYMYSSGSLTITYYTEPDFTFEGKKFDPQYLCGEDTYLRELPVLKGYLICKSSHSNIFDFYHSEHNQIDGMFCLWGGNDDMNYYNPIAITSGSDCDKYGHCVASTPIEQWITKHWGDMCKAYNIPVSNRSWNISRIQKDGDPTVYEFMDYLVEHQDDFKNYKQLPKVNKDRWS